jgi:hypothetical protein
VRGERKEGEKEREEATHIPKMHNYPRNATGIGRLAAM